jgi:hypothetical protein
LTRVVYKIKHCTVLLSGICESIIVNIPSNETGGGFVYIIIIFFYFVNIKTGGGGFKGVLGLAKSGFLD